MEFRVDLDVFRGPLDLLLYLVRKHELEITDIPVAAITHQYQGHLESADQLDVNAVGDFLEIASQLAEIKSRVVLPHGDEVEEALDDPRRELVQQLLEYKRFKDAASVLEEQGRAWLERFPRMAGEPAAGPIDPAEEPIREVELWDLVSAFSRVVQQNNATRGPNIVYDDTPIHVYMERIHAQLVETGRLHFSELFEPGMHKSKLVSIFLAILELVRHHGVRAEQDGLFGEIWLLPSGESEGGLGVSADELAEQVTSHLSRSEAADESSTPRKPRAKRNRKQNPR